MPRTWWRLGRRRRSRPWCRWCEAVKEYLDLAADFISKVGFPVFVAIILLWRDDARHTDNIRAIRRLAHTVKDRHLAVHCKSVAQRLQRPRRPRRPKDKRR